LDKLARLGAAISESQQAKRDARQSAWSNLCEKHPDIASHISAISAVFGKPKVVIVKDDTGIVLDSRRLK